VNPASVFDSGAYGFPQAVACAGGATLHVSGQVAWDAQRRLVGGADLYAQARQAFANVVRVVEAAGGDAASLLSVRIYVVDYAPADAVAIGRAFRETFPADTAPAATWVGVAALADPELRIEVEAIAALP
jgi:enamine deaminase RidA (YjgF/YER057c/UK114 family)